MGMLLGLKMYVCVFVWLSFETVLGTRTGQGLNVATDSQRFSLVGAMRGL